MDMSELDEKKSITTHVSVPSTQDMRADWKALMDDLETLRLSKKNLTEKARKAVQKVITTVRAEVEEYKRNKSA